eukprot:863653-Rhodomonas_salina.1
MSPAFTFLRPTPPPARHTSSTRTHTRGLAGEERERGERRGERGANGGWERKGTRRWCRGGCPR